MPCARPAVLAMARVARLSNAEASIVRTLFRLAETRRDGELYALLARRIDAYGGTRRPFCPQTRQYLRRRVARVLRRLGRAASADYVAMASAILLGYDDEDAVAAKTRPVPSHRTTSSRRSTRSTRSSTRTRPRYEKGHHEHSFWTLQRGYRPGEPGTARARRSVPRAVGSRAERAVGPDLEERRDAGDRVRDPGAARESPRSPTRCATSSSRPCSRPGHPLAQRFAFDVARGRPLTIVLARGALASDLPEAHAWVVGVDRRAPRRDGRRSGPARAAHHRQDAGRSARPPCASCAVAPLADAVAQQCRGPLARDPARPVGYAGKRRARVGCRRRDPARARSPAARHRRRRPARPGEASARGARRARRRAHPAPRASRLAARRPHRGDARRRRTRPCVCSAAASSRRRRPRSRRTTSKRSCCSRRAATPSFAKARARSSARSPRTYPDVGRALADRLVDALLATQPPGAPAHIVSLLRGELAEVLPKKSAATILKLDRRAVAARARRRRPAAAAARPRRPRPRRHRAPREPREPRGPRRRVGARAVIDPALPDRTGRARQARRFAVGRHARVRDRASSGTRSAATSSAPTRSSRSATRSAPRCRTSARRCCTSNSREADAGRYLVRLAEHPSTNLQLLVSGLLDRYATRRRRAPHRSCRTSRPCSRRSTAAASRRSA